MNKITDIADARGVSGYQTPAEEREAEDNMSVALAQPHRRQLTNPKDQRAGSPLWEACERLKLREQLFRAGEDYGRVSRNYKSTINAHAYGEGNAGELLTEKQTEARAKLAKDNYWKCINALRRADPMAQGVIERVCYDLRPLGYHEHDSFRKGLLELAIVLKTLDLGINEGKQISA